MGRRHKPSRWPVNWTVVGVAAVLTLIVGVVIAFLAKDDRRGGIVVPAPSAPPALIKSTGPEPAVGASILPGR
ncbi:hypothetical protein LWC34_40610 [Kibdelosporangium philippinense]|uniref:Uncharacterized protein n=1 Tax=Kibdelosporangium philippinense TaxID=211113 RepID=A0ABS8ZTB6_9PSEU|nr:hypothetical protein [Kibdelosporangium philippinense]MCE7009072.1 hypothetical protein [Kibdelosporangium philippinense]